MFTFKKKAWIFSVLWSTFAGTMSFFIGAVIGSLLLLRLDHYILATFVSGGLGGLLLGVCLIKTRLIGKMAIAGLIAIPVGFWCSFILAEGLFSLPFIHNLFKNPNVPDVITIICMGIISGLIFGAITFGRQSVWIFSAAGAIASLPFGIIVALFNASHPIKEYLQTLLTIFGPVDLHFLAIMTSFGVGIGLSSGLLHVSRER